MCTSTHSDPEDTVDFRAVVFLSEHDVLDGLVTAREASGHDGCPPVVALDSLLQTLSVHKVAAV